MLRPKTQDAQVEPKLDLAHVAISGYRARVPWYPGTGQEFAGYPGNPGKSLSEGHGTRGTRVPGPGYPGTLVLGRNLQGTLVTRVRASLRVPLLLPGVPGYPAAGPGPGQVTGTRVRRPGTCQWLVPGNSVGLALHY